MCDIPHVGRTAEQVDAAASSGRRPRNPRGLDVRVKRRPELPRDVLFMSTAPTRDHLAGRESALVRASNLQRPRPGRGAAREAPNGGAPLRGRP